MRRGRIEWGQVNDKDSSSSDDVQESAEADAVEETNHEHSGDELTEVAEPSRPRGNSTLANVATNAAVAFIAVASIGAIGLGIWLDHSGDGDEVANAGVEQTTAPASSTTQSASSTKASPTPSTSKAAENTSADHEIVHLPPTVTEVTTALDQVTVTGAPQTVVQTQTQTQTQQVTVVQEVPVTVEVPTGGGTGGTGGTGGNGGTGGTDGTGGTGGDGTGNQGTGEGAVAGNGITN